MATTTNSEITNAVEYGESRNWELRADLGSDDAGRARAVFEIAADMVWVRMELDGSFSVRSEGEDVSDVDPIYRESQSVNDWDGDVTSSDRIVVWGQGRSDLYAVRTADSDPSFLHGLASARAWAAQWGDDGLPVDAWIVALAPGSVYASRLDADAAVAGYAVCESGC